MEEKGSASVPGRLLNCLVLSIISLTTRQTREVLVQLGGGMFKQGLWGCTWRDDGNEGWGGWQFETSPTALSLLPSSLAKPVLREWMAML
jgi:hypothetical protein